MYNIVIKLDEFASIIGQAGCLVTAIEFINQHRAVMRTVDCFYSIVRNPSHTMWY